MRTSQLQSLLLVIALLQSVVLGSSSTSSSLVADGDCDPDYQQLNESTGECECRDGFSGLGCRMCEVNDGEADSDVCSAALGSDYSCVSGFDYDSGTSVKTYTCTLSSTLQALFPDGALDVSCDRDEQGDVTCSAAVYKTKDTVNGVHVIDCNMTQCSFATGEANGECENIECKCGPECSTMSKSLVEGSLSGKPAKIQVTGSSQLSIVIEGSPLPLSATCKASGCEKSKSTANSESSGSSTSIGASAGDDSDDTDGVWLAVVACGILLMLLLLGVFVFCCCPVGICRGNKEELETELLKVISGSAKTLEFRNISCHTNGDNKSSVEPTCILDRISGSVSRGQVLGLLGPSGSGKTTLLNALAAVKNGNTNFSGELFLDGEKVTKGYRRVAAYVQQDDTLYSTLTVRECIAYSAQLRLPLAMSASVKNSMVDRVIAELNLSHVANSRIGLVGGSSTQRGVSGGERRRVSIGMELVTSPQILILDEPTSGLDSSSAHSVVQLLKELASHGRIVVLSIHQPSARSFLLLDKIMLLGKGSLLYSGAPAVSKGYFHGLGFKCPENENIADFILDIASDTASVPVMQADQENGAIPPTVSIAVTSDAKISQLKNSPRIAGSPAYKAERSPFVMEETPKARSKLDSIQSLIVEIRVLFARTAQNILRHRSLLVLHVVLSLALALFGGLIFNGVTNDLAGFQNRMGAFYFILTFFGFASMSSMDLFIAERQIFLRETGAMYYGAFSYFLAKATLDMLLLRVLPASLFAGIFYWIMGLQSSVDHFLLFWLTLVLFNVAAGAICLLVGVLTRRVGAANLGATVVLLIMLLFGGFLLNSQTMPGSVGWLKHLSIFGYAFEILMVNELKGIVLSFDAPGYPAVPVFGEVYLKTLDMDYTNRYYDVAALALIAIVLHLVAFLFLSFQVPAHQTMANYAKDTCILAPKRKDEGYEVCTSQQ